VGRGGVRGFSGGLVGKMGISGGVGGGGGGPFVPGALKLRGKKFHPGGHGRGALGRGGLGRWGPGHK